MANQHIPQRVPESMGVVEIGATMASLRAQYGLSAQDVSERLHIRVRYVNAIEEGKFELMPGKVYARGYVHTYAEFLGLDADQVVAQCFASPATAEAKTIAPPPAKISAPSRAQVARNWRGIGIAAVVAIIVLVLFTQLSGSKEKDEDATDTDAAQIVAPVPEALEQSLRTSIMPVAQNYDCLTGDDWLSCFFSDNATQEITGAEIVDRAQYGELPPPIAAAAPVPDGTTPADSAPDTGHD
jgi:hypothetical protein